MARAGREDRYPRVSEPTPRISPGATSLTGGDGPPVQFLHGLRTAAFARWLTGTVRAILPRAESNRAAGRETPGTDAILSPLVKPAAERVRGGELVVLLRDIRM
jgi:hypothetical protein